MDWDRLQAWQVARCGAQLAVHHAARGLEDDLLTCDHSTAIVLGDSEALPLAAMTRWTRASGRPCLVFDEHRLPCPAVHRSSLHGQDASTERAAGRLVPLELRDPAQGGHEMIQMTACVRAAQAQGARGEHAHHDRTGYGTAHPLLA